MQELIVSVIKVYFLLDLEFCQWVQLLQYCENATTNESLLFILLFTNLPLTAILDQNWIANPALELLPWGAVHVRQLQSSVKDFISIV